MRRTLSILFASVLLASPAWAQESAGYTTRVTGFAAPGVAVEGANIATGFTPLRAGGMVEQVGANGLGFALDASYLTTFENFGDVGITMISSALLYEFGTAGPVKPYLRGGPGLLLGSGDSAFIVSYGGGINYWVKENFGLKVEGRHSFLVEEPRAGFIDLLVGATFRF